MTFWGAHKDRPLPHHIRKPQTRPTQKMASRGANVVVSRAYRMRQKLQSALEATLLEIEDVSHQHAGHAAMRALPNAPHETHFNLKIVSPKFTGHTLVKRHRMVYDLLADELSSGLHAISIVAKTPQEVQQK